MYRFSLGLKGKCTNVVTACASGTHCIGDAFRAIQYGDADVMRGRRYRKLYLPNAEWQDLRL